MTAFRALTVSIAALPLALIPTAAMAQVDDAIVLNILRNCAQIDDATARLACYDNNIRQAGGEVRNSVPGEMAVPRGGSGAPLNSGGASGFGAEDIRTADRFETPAGQLEELRARVSSVRERQPGMYVITLEDGAQWQFAESVPFSYRVPSRGDRVEIDRGALGSFLLTYDRQASVRVRRIR